MTKVKHSPLPWSAVYSDHTEQYENEDWIIYSGVENLCSGNYYSTPGIKKEEDAAFIIRACNSHYELLAALELTVKMYEGATGLPIPSQAFRAILKAKGDKQ